MPDTTVLIVEDEENILEAVRYNLIRDGYRVLTATDGEEGLEIARQAAPDLVLLDIMLPKLNGLEVCKLLKADLLVPIIMLTARSEEADRVIGLELGADDYIVKPFGMRELMARVKALLRRTRSSAKVANPVTSDHLSIGAIDLNLRSHSANVTGVPIKLTRREFALLSLLMSNVGRVFTRNQILERLWGHDYFGDTRTVDVHIRWLRQKIEFDPSKPKHFVTIRGIGYRFDA